MNPTDSSLITSPASMFVRIRPLAKEGGHASRKAGEKAAKSDLKRLKTFSDSCVTVKDLKTGQDQDYEYMKQVILPDDRQEDTFNKMGLPEMLEQFLSGYNATFLAYGQTGTGKTHTMFGSRLDKVAAHDQQPFPDERGIFPRAVMTALERMKEKGGRYIFTANIIEIYFGGLYDLLNAKKTVHSDQYYGGDFDFHGVYEMEVKNSEDVDRFV